MSKVLQVTWRRVFSKWRLCIIRNYKQLNYADLELVIHNGHKEIHRSPAIVKDGKLNIHLEITPPDIGLIHIQVGTCHQLGLINKRFGKFEPLPEHIGKVAITSLEERTGQEYTLPVHWRQTCH
jgi:hypothetical protein